MVPTWWILLPFLNLWFRGIQVFLEGARFETVKMFEGQLYLLMDLDELLPRLSHRPDFGHPCSEFSSSGPHKIDMRVTYYDFSSSSTSSVISTSANICASKIWGPGVEQSPLYKFCHVLYYMYLLSCSYMEEEHSEQQWLDRKLSFTEILKTYKYMCESESVSVY